MTGMEKDHLQALEVRLFGFDGEGGAIGDLNAQLKPVKEFYQQALGVLRVIKWMGAVLTLAAVIGIAKASNLL